MSIVTGLQGTQYAVCVDIARGLAEAVQPSGQLLPHADDDSEHAELLRAYCAALSCAMRLRRMLDEMEALW